MSPKMTFEDVRTLLHTLDELFVLGGKLWEAALVRHPELNTTPLPDLSELDTVRADALNRVSER